MLDSLVRVSRRVGWGADRLATDPELDAATPGPRPPAVPEHCEQSSGVERTERARARRRGGISSVRKPAIPPTGCNTRRRSAEPPSRRASDGSRTGRGALPAESAPGDAGSKEGRSARIRLPPRPTNAELNSAGRLCGPIRLPLNGFTYFELSLQSSFQLSLTVLVRYRTRVGI